METERNGSISFLDVTVTRKQDGTLTRSIYRKPTHTDRYLHGNSFHHPKIKVSVNRTLVCRAYSICDVEHLDQELHHITTAQQHNSSQTSTTGFPTDFERPLKSTSMTLYHRTLVSTSAIFGAPSSHLSPMGPLYPVD